MLYAPTPTFTLISPILPLLRRCLALLLWLLVGLAPLRAQAAAEPVTPCIAEPTDMTITFGQLVDCKIDIAGDNDVFRFEGTANSVIVLSLRTTNDFGSQNFRKCSGYMALSYCSVAKLYSPGYKPGDTPLLTLNPDNGTKSQKLTLPATGTYIIRIQDDNNNETPNYRLGLERLFPASLSARDISFVGFSDNLDLLDQDFYTFVGGKNDFIGLNSTAGAIAELYGPDQTLLLTVNGAEYKELELLAEGQYMVHLYDSGNDEARGYSFNLQCVLAADGSANCGAQHPASYTCKGLTPTLVGTSRNDTLIGTAGNDIIAGLGGHDRISGLGGDDIICGDSDQGGAGNDTLFGGDGHDTLIGGDGVNVLFGEAGNDTLSGGNHRDSLFGGAGNDNLDGKSNDDVLIGGAGNDLVDGNTGTRDICDKAADDLTPAKGCEFKGTP